jgi:hypothetical protein
MVKPAQQQNQPAPQAAPVVRVARTPALYTIVEPLDFSQRNDITILYNLTQTHTPLSWTMAVVLP